MFQATAFVHGIPLPMPTCTTVAFSHPVIYIALVSVSAFYRAINYMARCTFHTHRYEVQRSICKMTSFIMVCSFKNSIASSLVRHALSSASFFFSSFGGVLNLNKMLLCWKLSPDIIFSCICNTGAPTELNTERGKILEQISIVYWTLT